MPPDRKVPGTGVEKEENHHGWSRVCSGHAAHGMENMQESGYKGALHTID